MSMGPITIESLDAAYRLAMQGPECPDFVIYWPTPMTPIQILEGLLKQAGHKTLKRRIRRYLRRARRKQNAKP
jgi:hypothetical protein